MAKAVKCIEYFQLSQIINIIVTDIDDVVKG